MFCAFLCGLLYGGLLYGVWQKEVRRRRNERIYGQIRNWWQQEGFGASGVGDGTRERHPPDCGCNDCYVREVLDEVDPDDLPFSEDPLPEDAELPSFTTFGTATSYDGEF